MQGDSVGIANRLPTTRSKITNGTRLLAGDQRSPGARRYRDLCTEYASDLGAAFEALPEAAKQTVRRLSGVSVSLEGLEAQSASGVLIDAVMFCRLIGQQRRLLKDLQAVKAAMAKPAANALQEHIARHYSNRPADAAA